MKSTTPPAGPRALLPELFRAIHVDPDERISVCHDLGGKFTATHGTAETAGPRAEAFAGRANVWHSVSTLVEDIPVGRRGNSDQVARVTSLFTDLDVGGTGRCLPDWDAARAVVTALDRALGVPCPAMVLTGGGVHPYWPISGGADLARAEVVLDQFEILVRSACNDNGGDVDNVHEIARVLRTPGTENMKIPDQPRPVELRLRKAVTPIPLAHLEGILPDLPPVPAPQVIDLQVGAGGDPYRRLRGLVQTVLDSGVGERNNTLNWAAHKSRELVGEYPADTIASALVQAGCHVGLDQEEATSTVASGMGARS